MQDSATDIQYQYHALINKLLYKVHSALMITYIQVPAWEDGARQ